jgi:NAD(P)-dependent dehydrogenase (short-subunit alcohol dehydrogenase family)
MDPPPDHGERSYRGSGRLTGRKALITGGDSGMGRAAAIAFAREGADVAINYYPTEEPDAREVIELISAEQRLFTPRATPRTRSFTRAVAGGNETILVVEDDQHSARQPMSPTSWSAMPAGNSRVNPSSTFPARISMRP